MMLLFFVPGAEEEGCKYSASGQTWPRAHQASSCCDVIFSSSCDVTNQFASVWRLRWLFSVCLPSTCPNTSILKPISFLSREAVSACISHFKKSWPNFLPEHTSVGDQGTKTWSTLNVRRWELLLPSCTHRYTDVVLQFSLKTSLLKRRMQVPWFTGDPLTVKGAWLLASTRMLMIKTFVLSNMYQ